MMSLRALPLTLLALTLLAAPAAVAQEQLTLKDFRREGYDYAFLQWQKALERTPGGLVIGGEKTRGQGGVGVNQVIDLFGFAEACPVLRVRLGEHHQAKEIHLNVKDEDGTESRFSYDLTQAGKAEATTLFPKDGAMLGSDFAVKKDGGDGTLDVRKVTGWVLVGDWKNTPVHVVVEQVGVTRDLPADLAEARRQAEAEEAERLEQERRRAQERRAVIEKLVTEGADHPADGPEVVHVYPVGPNLLGIAIQDRTVPLVDQASYEPQPEDKLKRGGEDVWAWSDGKLVKDKLKIEVLRPQGKGKGKAESLGSLAVREEKVWPGFESHGMELVHEALGDPRAYRVSSSDDPAYATAVQPEAVHVKRKPNAYSSKATLARIYLQLPEPMQADKHYTVAFVGVNTRQPTVTYRHTPRSIRSEAVHVSHIGYRPDDPFKQGVLSVWLGTGGAHDFAAGGAAPGFAVIDEATGQAVFTGQAKHVLSPDDQESFKSNRNYAGTHAYHLDFSSLREPGEYHVYVEGVGRSDAFRIAEDVWQEAFEVAMLGALHHRSGIELGPPLTEYRRPMTMKPGVNGFAVYPVDATTLDGESKAINAAAGRLAERGPLPDPLPQAWGGWMDAGDWDRRSTHFGGNYLLLELYEIFPQAMANLKLRLPADEAGNHLPDVLDEALWNLAFFHRMQEADGGVRGGIESSAHPRPGETSWQESLFVGAFAPDPRTSYDFAANAGKFARLVAELDSSLANTYREAALKAWAWAERALAALPEGADRFTSSRNLAALELYWLTEDPAFHEAFKQTTIVGTDASDVAPQDDAAFTYARLPDRLADAQLKTEARAATLAMADRGLAFADGNAFGITMPVNLPPMGWVNYFTLPGGLFPTVPRAYVLTGEQKYLAGTIRSANYAAGANPDNRAMTTGIGPNPVQWPLHLDSWRSGQAAPAGITVGGQSDPAENYDFEGWVYTWHLSEPKMIPAGRSWPAYEAFADIGVSPANNEYTIGRILINAYNWGVLAARP